nr:uncharacterized protein LOC123753623 [Procambarus clarkii]
MFAGITKAYTEEFAKTYKLFETTTGDISEIVPEYREDVDSLTPSPSIIIEGKVWGREEIEDLKKENQEQKVEIEDLMKKLKEYEETVKEHKQLEHSLKERLKKYEVCSY